MTDLSKLIEEMEAAGEGRTDGPWEAVLSDDGWFVCEEEGFQEPIFDGDAESGDACFIAFAGTHWQRILEALKQSQAENERLREFAQLFISIENKAEDLLDQRSDAGKRVFVEDMHAEALRQSDIDPTYPLTDFFDYARQALTKENSDD